MIVTSGVETAKEATAGDSVRPQSATKVQPEPPPLQGREILVDSYNLRLTHGSGIKTYGLTLLEQIKQLGGSAALLGDRPVPGTRDRALAEVLFYDHAPKEGRWRRLLGQMTRGMRTMLATVAPVEIQRQFVLPDESMRSVRGIARFYNVGRIYETANHNFKRFGRFTRVRLPQRADIWHATTLLPIQVKGAAMVTTIHDLIPLRLPYTTLDDKKFFFNLTKAAVRRSDLILTVSECSKRDVQLFFDVPDEKIVVTYQPVPFRRYRPDARLEESALKRYQLDRGRYVLFVGNIEPKKNLLGLIKAMGGLSEDLALVVVGRKGWLWKDQIEPAAAYFGERGMKRRFRLLDFVPRDDLRALYANAHCLAFPSLYEGFGLPPLEAMAHGCPVVVSDAASLPEICGEAASYCDPYDPDSIRQRIEELLAEPARRHLLIEAGNQRVEHFAPERMAQRLMKAYSRVL
jgi:glycosyltransferase involved in cell wall biosynthesis